MALHIGQRYRKPKTTEELCIFGETDLPYTALFKKQSWKIVYIFQSTLSLQKKIYEQYD
jgi:hypothetical protein